MIASSVLSHPGSLLANSTLFQPGPRSGPVHAKNGYRYDNRLTAMMVEDMLFNPLLAAKVILDVDCPPHQELRLLLMWTHGFTIDDSGFSTGKTFTAAMVIALRSCLMTNRVSGVLSKTFRQGKLIHAEIERWSKRSKVFSSTIAKQFNGKPKFIHAQDVHIIDWKGGSQLRVLPPSFMKDSENLRSERWNDEYGDEWNTWGNYEAMTSIIFGRATRVNDYPDCPVRSNHIHLFSTPKFTHHESYKLIERIEADMKQGNKDYARFTCNYRHVPRTRRWRRMVDRKAIRLMQTTGTPGVVASEIDGIWQKDSLTIYSSYYIDEARRNWQANQDKYPILCEREHEDDTYLCAFDMARGSTDRKKLKGDDFGFVIYRLPADADYAYPCFAFRSNGVKAQQASSVLHKYHLAFQFSYIAYDPQGGGMFVADEMAKGTQRIEGRDEKVVPLLDIEDDSGLLGDRIMVPIRRGTQIIKAFWPAMLSDNVFINRMHGLLKQDIENGLVPFVSIPPILDDNLIDGISNIRDYMHKRAKSMSEFDRAWCELYLMSLQVIEIDVRRKEGTLEPMVDSKGMMMFASKDKKDLAYCLLYTNTLYHIYLRLVELGVAQSKRNSKRATVFASMRPL